MGVGLMNLYKTLKMESGRSILTFFYFLDIGNVKQTAQSNSVKISGRKFTLH